MKLKSMKSIVTCMIFSIASLFNIANASVLTGNLNVDNTFSAYLSTDDNVQGALLVSGNDWTVTDTFSTNLTAGTDYYLHVKAQDWGYIAGFLGDFSIDTNDHVFNNGLAQLLTNTVDWNVSTTGWNNYTTASTSLLGTSYNGIGPWGLRSGVDANADWIWSSESYTDLNAYFSTTITAVTAVPAPSTMIIFGLALIGLASRRFKKQA